MIAGGFKETTTTVIAINQTTGTPVNLDPPGNRSANDWHAEVLALPTATTTITTEPAIPTTAVAGLPSTASPTDITLPKSGSTGTVTTIAALLTFLAAHYACGTACSRRLLRH